MCIRDRGDYYEFVTYWEWARPWYSKDYYLLYIELETENDNAYTGVTKLKIDYLFNTTCTYHEYPIISENPYGYSEIQLKTELLSLILSVSIFIFYLQKRQNIKK